MRNELTRYLSDNWAPVIEKDVAGERSQPLAIDREAPNLGKHKATQRVARTLYLGSAPIAEAARRGIEDIRIKLGCVMPGESPAVFGDGLRRLAAKATYLYQDGTRYWYDTQPTVAKLAEDRAEEFRRNPDAVAAELERRLRADLRERGAFARVHAFPKLPGDVPDECDARLVVLSPDALYIRGDDSPAQALAKEILQSRGSAPRLYRNALVFLAADGARFQDLDEALRRYLAWESILRDVEKLNLDPHQKGQSKTRRDAADGAVLARIPETYRWLLFPDQDEPTAEATWKAQSLSASGALAERAAKRLFNDERLVDALGPTVLNLHLNRIPLWRGDPDDVRKFIEDCARAGTQRTPRTPRRCDVGVRQLVEDFAQHLYLPRLTSGSVLVRAIREGVRLLTWETESFAFADGFDESTGDYLGLRFREDVDVTTESRGLVVHPAVACRQHDAKGSPEPSPREPVSGAGGNDASPRPDEHGRGPAPVAVSRPPPRRFHAAATLNPGRIGSDASRIADEVVSHLDGLVGSQVKITLGDRSGGARRRSGTCRAGGDREQRDAETGFARVRERVAA